MMSGYAEALWKAHKGMNESADFVMYWWDRAAEILTRKKTPLRRFGFVTTNSISQVFQRRVMERHLNAKTPVSIVFAVPDHPWTKATKDSAAVRIAMTAVRAGSHEGELREVVAEAGLETDAPRLEFASRGGKVNSDLTVGTNVAATEPLLANKGLASRGVQLMGAGFIVTPEEAVHLGLGRRPGLERHIREYRNGRDLTASPRGVMVIDLFGMTAEALRRDYPEVYQHLLVTVKETREAQVMRSPTTDAIAYLQNWWIFGKPRTELRPALTGLSRYIGTVETAKHRLFQFLDATVLPDNMVVAIASDDSLALAALSSRVHVVWALHTGGVLEDRPRYTKGGCFDPFPFPDPSEALRTTLRDLGEELDATRKIVQAEHPDLTLTGLYNVLEKVRAGAPLDVRDEDVKDRGRVLILKDLHDQIDRATMQAYGWEDLIPSLSSSSGKRSATGGPSGDEGDTSGTISAGGERDSFALSRAAGSPGRFAPEDDESKKGAVSLDEIILERLVALNAERAAEEAAGHVRWLRPDYQIPRFAKGAAAKSGRLDLQDNIVAIDKSLPAFPKDKGEQVMAIRAVLVAHGRPMDAAAVARAFKNGGKKIEQRVVQALNTLVRYAEITALPGGAFVARKAA